MLINEGKRIGIAEGKSIGKNIMCKNMLKRGYSVKTVSEISGLPIKEIEKLKLEDK